MLSGALLQVARYAPVRSDHGRGVLRDALRERTNVPRSEITSEML
jgi:hypothetical protein